jgi:hypothetical protein
LAIDKIDPRVGGRQNGAVDKAKSIVGRWEAGENRREVGSQGSL